MNASWPRCAKSSTVKSPGWMRPIRPLLPNRRRPKPRRSRPSCGREWMKVCPNARGLLSEVDGAVPPVLSEHAATGISSVSALKEGFAPAAACGLGDRRRMRRNEAGEQSWFKTALQTQLGLRSTKPKRRRRSGCRAVARRTGRAGGALCGCDCAD